MGDDLPIYLIMGHGEETLVPFEERVEVPKDVQIVTLAKAGTVSRMPEVCSTIQLFTNSANKDLLEHPKENRAAISEAIGQNIHVYQTGQKIPNLHVSPLAYWKLNDLSKIRAIKAVRSGVQPFPLTKSVETEPFASGSFSEKQQKNILTYDITFEPSLKTCGQYIKMYPDPLEKDNLHEIYENSLYPTIKQVEEYVGAPPQYIAHYLTKNLMDIVKEIGPGTYYYVICRAEKGNASLVDQISTYLFTKPYNFEEFEDLPFTPEHLQQILKANNALKNHLQTIPDFVDRMQAFLDGFETLDPAYQAFIFKEIVGIEDYTPEQYPQMFKSFRDFVARSRLVRTMSNEQQAVGGKRNRKTKRKSKKSHKTRCARYLATHKS